MEIQNYKIKWILTNLEGSNKWRGTLKDSVLTNPKTTVKINNKFTNKIKYKIELEVVKEVEKTKSAIFTQMATKEVKDNKQDL